MAEVKTYTFKHKEVVEALVKKQDLHEGIWGIYIEFGISAGNVSNQPDQADMTPAAIIPVLKIGLQRFDKENNLSVDAAEVNPVKGKIK